jgi:hypothetical protein
MFSLRLISLVEFKSVQVIIPEIFKLPVIFNPPDATIFCVVIVCDAVRFVTVIVPAVKSPLMSLATNVFAVLTDVPATETVLAVEPL